MNRTSTVVAMAAAFAFAFASAASAQTTRTVCASGCQYTSINAAIDDASDDDVIQLAAEIYAEGVTIKTDGKAIRILGTADKSGIATSILDGSDSHRVLECTDSEGIDTIFAVEGEGGC